MLEIWVLGSLTSEVGKKKMRRGRKEEENLTFPLSHSGEPALMHFNEPVSYTGWICRGIYGHEKMKL